MWSLVIPVKRLYLAKTRLSATLTGDPRVNLLDEHSATVGQPPDGDRLPANGRIALAMASDTVRAALACSLVASVLVVTDDLLAAGTLTALGARVVPDTPDDGLNAALRYGAQAARAQCPAGGVAALSADLAALRSDELAEALARAESHPRAFVADAAGSGTTLLCATPDYALDPRFGDDSARAHLRSGAQALDGTWPSLRRDLDTPQDLAIAARLGLGPSTAAQVAVLMPALDHCAC